MDYQERNKRSANSLSRQTVDEVAFPIPSEALGTVLSTSRATKRQKMGLDNTSPLASDKPQHQDSLSTRLHQSLPGPPPCITCTTDLRQLEQPVIFQALNDNPADQLPQDVFSLYRRIHELAVEPRGILDYRVRAEIEAILGRQLKDELFTEPDEQTFLASPDLVRIVESANHLRALGSLETLQAIQSAAHSNMMSDEPQLRWYNAVALPFIDHALAHDLIVNPGFLTFDRIAPAFYPRAKNGQSLSNSTVMDCALLYSPSFKSHCAEERAMLDLIGYRVSLEPEGEQYVNPTNSIQTRYRPISILIASTFAESPDEGRARLGLWAAAWHRRMRVLLKSGRAAAGDEEQQQPMITLPLIHVIEHEWKLLFACDRGNGIEVLCDMSIGDTKTLLGLSKLKAVLSELANWINSVFAPWIKERVESSLQGRPSLTHMITD